MEMINFETLAIIAVLTALATEAVKTLFNSKDANYSSNVIAAVTSVILSAAVVVVIPVVSGKAVLNAELITNGVVMAFFAVLCAVLSYDKVIQTIKQIKA